jgi:hypothetical protein
MIVPSDMAKQVDFVVVEKALDDEETVLVESLNLIVGNLEGKHTVDLWLLNHIAQLPHPSDVNADPVSPLQREIVRRHNSGAGQ